MAEKHTNNNNKRKFCVLTCGMTTYVDRDGAHFSDRYLWITYGFTPYSEISLSLSAPSLWKHGQDLLRIAKFVTIRDFKLSVSGKPPETIGP